MSEPLVTLIISFYNHFSFLELVLAGLERQIHKNFEIIIADDGSKDKIIKKINNYKNTSALNIKHVWHEDKGWRKNRILNFSVQQSSGEYLVFTDGDCIPHKAFIHEHLLNKQPNTVLAGRRVNLSKNVTDLLTPSKVKKGFLETRLFPLMIWEAIMRRGDRVENGLYFRNKFIRKRINLKDRGILGSNFSIYKSDILAINGFDERYEAPAVGEDTDLEYRLKLNETKVKTVKHLAIQYHLYHPKLSRPGKNLDILYDTMEKKNYYTPYGINKSSSK
jgi:glycosyltransferase involved in cell wall biosynthesis